METNELNLYWTLSKKQQFVAYNETYPINGFVYLILEDPFFGYIGNLVNSIAEGYGALLCPFGIILSGTFKNGFPKEYNLHACGKYGFTVTNDKIIDKLPFIPLETGIPSSLTAQTFSKFIEKWNINDEISTIYKENDYFNSNITSGIKKCFPISIENEIDLINKNSTLKSFLKKEGIVSERIVSIFERDRSLRDKCIEIFGNTCFICGFNFDTFYGSEIANRYIEIHHLNELRNGERLTNPETDLVPLCANCHAIIHNFSNPNKEALDLLKSIVTKRR